MVDTYVTLKDASAVNAVNSGNPVNMLANEISWNFGTFTPSPQVPNKATTYSWNYRLANVDYVGHSNPTISISGVIPTEDAKVSGPTTPTWLTFVLLWSFCKSGHELIVWDKRIINPLVTTTPVGETAPPYATDGGMRVRILNCSVTRTQETETELTDGTKIRGYILTYDMELIEVQR